MFRFPQHDTAVYEMGSSHSCTSSVVRLLFALLKQGALDKLRKDRNDKDLHVPLLSGDPGMHGHVLHRELKLDWQRPKFHHLGQAEPDGHRPDVLRRRIPVRQDIARVPEAPALAEEDGRDGLQVHLVRVGPAVHARRWTTIAGETRQ